TRSTNGQIYVYDATNITIRRNWVHDITSTGANDAIKLGADNFSNTALFVGNVLDNLIEDVVQDGIAVYSSDALISGNEITGSSSTNGAIHIQKSSSTPAP